MKSPYTNGSIVLLWWLMNFAMPNVFDSIVNFPPILAILLTMKEILRNKKIYSGIDKAMAAYDGRKSSIKTKNMIFLFMTFDSKLFRFCGFLTFYS